MSDDRPDSRQKLSGAASAWSRDACTAIRCCASWTPPGEACVCGSLLQREGAPRALQHGRHPEGAIHGLPHRGRVLYSDMGRVLCLDRRRHLRVARHPRRLRRRRSVARQVRRGELPKAPQRLSPERSRQFLVELGKHGLGKRDIGRQRELLRRDRRSTATGSMEWRGGQQPPGRLRRFALRDGHAGRPQQHAASARSRHAPTRPRPSSSSCDKGALPRRMIPAACRGPRTAAVSP